MLKAFFVMALGNAILYEVLFWLLDRGPEKRIFSIQFESDLWFTAVFTLVVTPITFFGGWLINYVYFQQGSAHDADSRFPQFLLWFAGYATFMFLSYFQRNEPFDKSTILSFLLLFSAVVVRYWGK